MNLLLVRLVGRVVSDVIRLVSGDESVTGDAPIAGNEAVPDRLIQSTADAT